MNRHKVDQEINENPVRRTQLVVSGMKSATSSIRYEERS
ncbi:unnamed protein product [Wuchereria bancrofti]|uniref:Uncharacterized protein n=1 Tax=Wuchereria bancrofti TaxID=6293 RepID=A0A3P7DXM7_WUCBA|nr:unnamed protein product [Wuchereria bancrofti]